jgi:SAM-dependent methyltransferase
MIGRFLRKPLDKLRAGRAPEKDKKRKEGRFAAWLEKNPTGTFEQFYAEKAARAATLGKPHASLGSTLKPGSLERARQVVDGWLTWGIRPSDTVVDYGCGTLRLGRLLIEFLEPGHYIGLDLDQRILTTGHDQLPPDLVALKHPMLEVISPESLRRTAARQPKWVCSRGVLQHVPPAELDRFFENLSILVLTGATGLINGRAWPRTERRSHTTWDYALEDLKVSAARASLDLERAETANATVLVLRASK